MDYKGKQFLFYKIKRKIRHIIFSFRKYRNDKEYLIALGKVRLGYKMNLDNPKTFNEKINWYKLNYRNELMTICADKYHVRQYVKDKGFGHILTKLYGVYDRVEDIDLSKLPNEFIIKVTGDSGGVVVCKNKDEFYNDVNNKFKNLNCDYSSYNKEWVYHSIKNRLIVEELIKTKNGKSPKDYKFFCFNGEPKFLYVASDRETITNFDFFDLNWNYIELKQGHPNSKEKLLKPDQFDEMLEISKALSKDFPFVRVDLYNENNKVFFGELTFFHCSGFAPFWPKKYDYYFGEFFDINTIISKQNK